MTIAYIGLGSNLGDREENLRKALEVLGAMEGIEVREVSEFIETRPAGGPSQPPFLNGAAAISTELPPQRLLAALQRAEREAGRVPRGVRWGPREADLDLILYGDLVLSTPDLEIPHPRFRDRLFVLEPLASIAPQGRDPVTGETIEDLLRRLRRRKSGKKEPRLITRRAELDEYVAMVKRNRFSLGFVPTMGAFHEGHLSLMRAARARCDKVLVSVFVNPTQFGPGEDYERYPRDLPRDLDLAGEVGVDVVFAPSVEEMVPPDHSTWVTVEGISDLYCGASRPGHFRGVATIVCRLFHMVRPDLAWFGSKDYQQSVIIRRMVRDLAFPVEVIVGPTVREEDGLALSSRNAYLSPEERTRATALYRGLTRAREAWLAGERDAAKLAARVRRELAAAEIEPEYVAVAHPDTLAALDTVGEAGAVVLVAARVGETRLIDNVLRVEEGS